MKDEKCRFQILVKVDPETRTVIIELRDPESKLSSGTFLSPHEARLVARGLWDAAREMDSLGVDLLDTPSLAN